MKNKFVIANNQVGKAKILNVYNNFKMNKQLLLVIIQSGNYNHV